MAGASMTSPFVRYNDVWVYASSDIEALVKKLDLRPTTSGANIRIFEPYDEGIFMNLRKIRDVNVVSDIQLYVDLFTYPARERVFYIKFISSLGDLRYYFLRIFCK